MIKMVNRFSRKTRKGSGSTRTIIDLRETLVLIRMVNLD